MRSYSSCLVHTPPAASVIRNLTLAPQTCPSGVRVTLAPAVLAPSLRRSILSPSLLRNIRSSLLSGILISSLLRNILIASLLRGVLISLLRSVLSPPPGCLGPGSRCCPGAGLAPPLCLGAGPRPGPALLAAEGGRGQGGQHHAGRHHAHVGHVLHGVDAVEDVVQELLGHGQQEGVTRAQAGVRGVEWGGVGRVHSICTVCTTPHTLGLSTSYSCPPTCCVRVTVLVVVVGLAVVVVGVAVVPREQQPHRVVLRHGVQQLGVLAVDQVPPAAGLPALVVDRAVGAQPAELEAVDAGAHGAGVVHLAEGRHVRVVAVPQLVRAAAHRAALDTADCPAPT